MAGWQDGRMEGWKNMQLGVVVDQKMCSHASSILKSGCCHWLRWLLTEWIEFKMRTRVNNIKDSDLFAVNTLILIPIIVLIKSGQNGGAQAIISRLIFNLRDELFNLLPVQTEFLNHTAH